MNQFTYPLIFTQLCSMAISQIAKILAGRTSLEALGSLAAIDGLLYAIAGIFSVFSVSFNIFGAKALGEKNRVSFYHLLSSSMTLNFSIGLCISMIILLFRKAILQALYGFQGELLETAENYLGIMAFYLLFTILNFTFTNLIKIEKKTTSIFTITMISSLIQVGFSFLLINGFSFIPALGLYGAGIASMISLFFTSCLYLFILRKPLKKAREFKPNRIGFLFKKSLPLDRARNFRRLFIYYCFRVLDCETWLIDLSILCCC